MRGAIGGLLVVLATGASAPLAPPGAERPHPVSLRRERLCRQFAHTRGRRGRR